MTRWRPPPERSSPYITAAGARMLEKEMKELWERRTIVVQHLAAAAAEGDRSENAEYIYRKKELREIDRRLRYLQQRIPRLKIVERPPGDPDRVYFGAWVTLENESGETSLYRIVGADEIDPTRGWISVDSPLARSLLGKRIDDEVSVTAPGGAVRWLILEICYETG